MCALYLNCKAPSPYNLILAAPEITSLIVTIVPVQVDKNAR